MAVEYRYETLQALGSPLPPVGNNYEVLGLRDSAEFKMYFLTTMDTIVQQQPTLLLFPLAGGACQGRHSARQSSRRG
jgi:hypothetical protein